MGSYWAQPAAPANATPPTESNDAEQYTDLPPSEASDALVGLSIEEGTPTSAPKGTDATFHVSDLLRKMTTEVKMDPLCTNQRREELEGVPGAFLVHNVMTADECAQWITASEAMVYEASPLSILAGSFQYSQRNSATKEIRDSARVLCDIPVHYVRQLESRLARFLPQTVTVNGAEWALKKAGPVNERWRFNKYAVGQRFAPHFDAGYTKSVNESTQLTLIVYLNEGFEGGQTTFFPGGKPFSWSPPNMTKEVSVVPKTGLCLIFFHNGSLSPRHEGAPHTSQGQFKYIIRSDIIYQRAIPM